MGRVRSATIKGRRVRISTEPIYGLAIPEGCEPELYVDGSLPAKKALEIILHEIDHFQNPSKSEQDVTRSAKETAAILSRLFVIKKREGAW